MVLAYAGFPHQTWSITAWLTVMPVLQTRAIFCGSPNLVCRWALLAAFVYGCIIKVNHLRRSAAVATFVFTEEGWKGETQKATWKVLLPLRGSETPLGITSAQCADCAPYIIFVADAADIVRGATNFMWSNFAPHGNFWWSCRTKPHYMTSNLAPQDKIVCPVE